MADDATGVPGSGGGDGSGGPPDEVMRTDSDSAQKMSIAEAAIRAAMGDAEMVATGTGLTVEQINRDYAVVLVGGESKILRELDLSDGQATDAMELLSKTAFDLWMRPHQTVVHWRGTTKLVPSSAIWLSSPDRRQYRGIEFAPAAPGQDRGRERYYNLWTGFRVAPDPAGAAKCQRFLDHVWENVAQENPELFDWVIAFFAHMVQRPGELPGVALVLRGRQGSGKSTVGDIMGQLMPPHYVLADQARYVSGQFNAHLASCLLLQSDEAFWAGDKDAEGRLKGLVTGRVQMIERKGVDPIRLTNHVRLMITTNHDWAVPAGLEERRFAVLDVGDRHLQDKPYFAALYRQMLEEGGLGGLLQYLLDFDLDSVDLGQVPDTGALYEQKLAGMTPEEKWWFNRLSDGTPTVKADEWIEEIPRAALQADYWSYAEKLGVRYKADPIALGIKLKAMVPDIGEARRMMNVTDEGSALTVRRRVWCYRLPPLQACRAAFAARMRSDVPWGPE